jgi:uncharacterized membrane protein
VIGEQKPNRLISWHSIEGSSLPNRGSVRFTPSDGGTRVDIRMGYTPPGGQLGHAVAAVFGDDPKSAMDEDLNRLKTLLESGSTSIGGRDVADNLGMQGEAGPWS